MNLTRFMKEVENILDTMSSQQLMAFIHDMARTLPENQRNSFLNKLEKIGVKEEGYKAEKREEKEKYEKKHWFISKRKLRKLINLAQKNNEEQSVLSRQRALDYDEVLQRQRSLIYETRDQLMDGGELENKKVLEIFVENGAPENILYEAKPHIGTDILKTVIKNMRNRIVSWGGEVCFESTVTDIIFESI